MTGYTVAWLIWASAFGIIEGNALRDRRLGDTLSEHIWRVFRVRDARPTPLIWALRAVLLAVMVWLTGHLVFGWWTL